MLCSNLTSLPWVLRAPASRNVDTAAEIEKNSIQVHIISRLWYYLGRKMTDEERERRLAEMMDNARYVCIVLSRGRLTLFSCSLVPFNEVYCCLVRLQMER